MIVVHIVPFWVVFDLIVIALTFETQQHELHRHAVEIGKLITRNH